MVTINDPHIGTHFMNIDSSSPTALHIDSTWMSSHSNQDAPPGESVVDSKINMPSSYPEHYKQMMVAGLLGAVYRRLDEAMVIHAALRPTLPVGCGYSMFHMISMGLGGGANLVEPEIQAHIDAHPDDDAAKVTLSVVKLFSGDPEWKPVMDLVLATSYDQQVRQAAFSVLQMLQRYRR